MKVLFAVNNDNVSEAIIKKYQKEFKEIISYKNVYYFNAILKELQNNKGYDRIVISEDLEPFANNNYDTIDKFLFDKLDKISDEATKVGGEDISIILICSDRRSKSDEMLSKVFGIGIYNALFGDDRTVENLCKLINQPRTKKEAKIIYKISSANIGYDDENNVSESEVQNILAHYKRLGRDEDKYVDSFNNIVAQYTDAQLKIIIRYLPMNVKAVLEERSPKYQELATYSVNSIKGAQTYRPNEPPKEKGKGINVKMLKNEKDKISKPIVIPSALRKGNKIKNEEIEEKIEEEPIIEQENYEEEKPRRGRPRKNPISTIEEEKPKRGRGRPKKIADDEEDEIDLFGLDSQDNDIEERHEEEPEELDLFNLDEEMNQQEGNEENSDDSEEELDLFNLDEENEAAEQVEEEIETDNNEMDFDLSDLEEDNKQEQDSEDELFEIDKKDDSYNMDNNTEESTEIEVTNKTTSETLNTLLTKDKKIVAFIGTTKNGTSFIVNNLALMLSSMNIKTAILDVTKNNNAYYIFTKNEQKLRDVAENSLDNLLKGNTNGIEVNKNLTVYTQLPGKEYSDVNPEKVLTTLIGKYDIVLIDTDFNTDMEYFAHAQEIYLVQSMDILTIQPLTAFLRNLKVKGILKQEKLKIVINKAEKVKTLTDKILIGGISSYNDPSMSYMTELFDRDNIMYCKIPFEVPNYVRYLDGLVNCEISLNGYTKDLISALNELTSMVYPLINRQTYSPMGNKKEKMSFSNSTMDTLNKMKKNY